MNLHRAATATDVVFCPAKISCAVYPPWLTGCISPGHWLATILLVAQIKDLCDVEGDDVLEPEAQPWGGYGSGQGSGWGGDGGKGLGPCGLGLPPPTTP